MRGTVVAPCLSMASSLMGVTDAAVNCSADAYTAARANAAAAAALAVLCSVYALVAVAAVL
jgi:hypothetical protein